MSQVDTVLKNSSSLNANTLNFDEDGFLLHSDEWSEATGQLIAELDGLNELGAAHWQVIHFVRERFFRLGAISSVRQICRNNEMSKDEVKDLFGSCLEMWRIAGLPHPGEEAKAYMS